MDKPTIFVNVLQLVPEDPTHLSIEIVIGDGRIQFDEEISLDLFMSVMRAGGEARDQLAALLADRVATDQLEEQFHA